MIQQMTVAFAPADGRPIEGCKVDLPDLNAWTPDLLVHAFASAIEELARVPAKDAQARLSLDGFDRLTITADVATGRVLSAPMVLPRDVIARLGLWPQAGGTD